MMGVIRYKIWSDLWHNKARTLQVVLIIGLGAAAIGMIVSTRNLVIGSMAQDWRSINPAVIALFANPRVDDDTLEVLRRIEGLEDVEGYAVTNIEWRHGPDEEWRAATLLARDDYINQTYNTVELIKGAWPRDESFAVELASEGFFDVPLGSQVHLLIDDREFVVNIKGVISNIVNAPPGFGGDAQFFTTRERLSDLAGIEGFNLLLGGAAEYDVDALTVVADEIKRKLEKQGVDSGGFIPPTFKRIVDPNKHFFQDVMDAIFFVLGVMAVLALILSLFLVYNTINAIISQQIDQIGIMKAIGGTTRQILGIYLLTVFAYGFMAMLIALPLGIVGGMGLTTFLLGSFNAEADGPMVSQSAVWVQVVIVILAPLLASLVPILTGSNITVNAAINTYGLQAESGFVERTVARIQNVSRLVLLTISNTFRNRGRVLLTQISLVLSGLIFMMVMSAGDSTNHTWGDVIFSILRFNINFVLDDPERIQRVETLTLVHPEVTAVEMWETQDGALRLAGTPSSDADESSLLLGVPLPTRLYGRQIREGRWLHPEDDYAVVLNQVLAADAGVGVGDRVTFDLGVRGESDWEVVGLLFDPVISTSALVPRETLLREIGSVGRASSIWIQTSVAGSAAEERIAAELKEIYKAQQLDVLPNGNFGSTTASGIVAQVRNNFGIIITLLATMAVVIGLVGSIALSGVLSLNVLERTREIGVMRAIGATSGDIGWLLVGEGVLLGWLSWVIAMPLSVPAGRVMTRALGAAVGGELVYKYTPAGAIYWLIIITILSVAASWFPARGAVRVSVRESLAYQ